MERTLEQSREMLTPKSYELPGTFHSEPVKVEVRAIPGSKRVVVNLHGTYGNMHGNSGKYRKFAENVAGSGLASSVVYSTSRNWALDAESDGSYEARMETFRWKTFEDELADARSVVADVISNSETRLGVPPDELEIILHGNSLGGIIALYLAKEFPQVKAVFAVGTGLRIDPMDVPILSTFPDALEVRSKAVAFRGDFMLECGTEDDTFSQDAFEELFSAVNGGAASRTAFQRYLGVDHSFKSVNGETDSRVFDTVTGQVLAYLEDGRLPSSDVLLEAPSETVALVRKYEWLTAELVAKTGDPDVKVSPEGENPVWE